MPKGGVIFNPKIYIADFGNFKQGFLSMKLIQISKFRVQGMLFQQLYWEKTKPDTLWRRHFWIPILSDPHTSWHMCNYIHYKKFAIYFSENKGEGQRPFGIFSKKSSDLVAPPFPKVSLSRYILILDFLFVLYHCKVDWLAGELHKNASKSCTIRLAS